MMTQKMIESDVPPFHIYVQFQYCLTFTLPPETLDLERSGDVFHPLQVPIEKRDEQMLRVKSWLYVNIDKFVYVT